MRQGRGSEATEAVFCLQAKKPLHSGSYEHRVPKKQNKTFSVCLIQHRNWPLRSTILNAHGTNASPDGLCTRTHTNEAFSCWFCCNSFRVDRARRGNVCLSSQVMLSYRSACPEIQRWFGIIMTMKTFFTLHITSCEEHCTEWRLPRWCPQRRSPLMPSRTDSSNLHVI